MGSIDWILELALVGLLAVVLVHAIRLERALQTLRNDRTALGEAIAGFDSSTRHAEAGISKLNVATAEASHVLGLRIEQAQSLKDDLKFLLERGDVAADRLDGLVRSGRAMASLSPAPASPTAATGDALPKVRSQAERDLLLALRGAQ